MHPYSKYINCNECDGMHAHAIENYAYMYVDNIRNIAYSSISYIHGTVKE
jgi:hypothetical protein